MKESVYQLLAARFCHDLASPINASGLLLEFCGDAETQAMAQQNQDTLVNLLQLYRILFAYREGQDLFSKASAVIQKACQLKGASLEIVAGEETQESRDVPSDEMGKILVCLFYSLAGVLREGDRVILAEGHEAEVSQSEAGGTPCFHLIWETSHPLPTLSLPPQAKEPSSQEALELFLAFLIRNAGAVLEGRPSEPLSDGRFQTTFTLWDRLQ